MATRHSKNPIHCYVCGNLLVRRFRFPHSIFYASLYFRCYVCDLWWLSELQYALDRYIHECGGIDHYLNKP